MDICSPIAGILTALSDVADPVFARAIVGPGVAITPTEESVIPVFAPVSGTIVKMHPHAFIIHTSSGHDILVHLGIDTVTLKGRGFTVYHTSGDKVSIGDIMAHWDLSEAMRIGKDTVVPVIVLDTNVEPEPSVWPGTPVIAGSPILRYLD
ncbi:PTS sugar transporter subunit IIA [Schaalia suimastitidis]|uniref:PTS sugar transporter subunit IIA n=1 Tax=Schaalia suimastitidis TaxID=121163 RepID=UPI000416EAE4|nr:PTS glucose transporter subunit IIA [Schaalia suimastitidis]